ncbi:hypothetical protein ACWEGE_12505 [Amycolatopsis sp. NPDC004747]
MGVLVTVFVTGRREAKRAEETRAERAREMRSDVYAEFYRVVAAFRRVADELGEAASAHRQAKTRLGQSGPEKTVKRLTDDVRALGDSAAMMYGRIRLLAPPDVVQAAERVVKGLTPYHDARAAGQTDSTEADGLKQLLDDAVGTMRRDLGTGISHETSR